MSREVKRVPLDFDYPLNMIWKGYISPYKSIECKSCEVSGASPEYKRLSDDWYGFDRPENKWCYKITEDEAKALWDAGRIKHTFKKCPTGDQVNKWAKNDILGHDAINQYICVNHRAKKLGITEMNCKYCDGDGYIYINEEIKQLDENFEKIEPPIGEGYQLWETTSEGSPVSPVFKTPELLATWLFKNNASIFGKNTTSYENWLNLIK